MLVYSSPEEKISSHQLPEIRQKYLLTVELYFCTFSYVLLKKKAFYNSKNRLNNDNYDKIRIK